MPEDLKQLSDEELRERGRLGQRWIPPLSCDEGQLTDVGSVCIDNATVPAELWHEALRRLEAAGNPDVDCPRCDVADGEIKRYGDQGWFVVCFNPTCKYEGPCRPTISEAIKAWKELEKGDPS